MKASVLQKGRGRDLVMMHGYLSCKESFYPQFDYFSRYYRVTAFDFLGFGESPPLTEPYSVDDYCDWTEDLLRELNIERPYVIAHSFGGRVAVKCLSRGDVFERAVLCGCAGIVPKRKFSYKMKVGVYRTVRKVAPRFAEKKFGSREYRTLSPVMRESYKKIVNEDLREAAKRIDRPVLFVNGEDDRETPPSSAKIYASCVKDSRLMVMPKCGHFAHLDDPLTFNLAVEEFFK